MSKITNSLFKYGKSVIHGSMFLSYTLMVFFIISNDFTMVANEGNDVSNSVANSTIFFEDSNNCMLSVDAGDDVAFCGSQEVTLTASVSGQSECVNCTGEYGVENTELCNGSHNYVLWLKGGRFFSDVDLKWTEFADGTATLKGTVYDYTHTQTTYEVDATFSGKTTNTPADSPKDHVCNTEDSSNWIYYTAFTGTITRTDGTWSTTLTRRGPAFQQGKGANQTEKEQGKYGACGWFDTTDSQYNVGDFNFNLGECVTTSTSEVNYLWSTGETTPSITVSEEGTYTVTVKDCKDCEASDEVKVTFNSLDVDAGDDQEICEGETVTLTATVSGDSDCIDCTEEYTVENTDLCNRTDENFVLCLVDGSDLRFFSNVDLVWKENQDGTASLKGTVYDHTLTNESYSLDVSFSGKNTYGSPGGHLCNQENSAGWIYYEEFSGSLKSQDGSWSTDISRRGKPFQLGNGANAGERVQGKYGASAGIATTDSQYTRGDLNLNLGDCIASETSNVSYLWSTGETTKTITVTPTETTTYSVTVNDDCSNCEATDTVSVVVKKGLQVDAGEDQEICGGEVTLTAEVQGAEQCGECIEYGIVDTEMCTGNGRKYVLWLSNPATGEGRFFTNVDLIWKKENDGTASLKGTVYSSTLNQNYNLDVIFTGETTVPPTAESPKDHFCYDEDASSWVYYPEYTGTITSEDGTWSTSITRTGPAFQLGNGANTNEMVEGRNAASGWFNTTHNEFTFGDININFGECISSQSDDIQYLWSTGETTQSITVAPTEDTVYTVTVTGCNDCGETTDDVLVSVSGGVDLDLGPDLFSCIGETSFLRSPIEGDSYLWSTGETTREIFVNPTEPTVYTLTVTVDGCSGSDEVLLTPIICGGEIEQLDIYPTVVEPNGKLSLMMKSANDQQLTISLHDLSGAAVGPAINKKISNGQGEVNIDLSIFPELSTGFYIFKVTGTNGDTSTHKVIVK